MSEPLRILFSFFLGELLLIIMVGWIYFQLRKMGILRPGTSTNRTVLLLFALLPILIAVFALPGLIYRMNIALSLLPLTGGSSTTITPIASTPTPPLLGNTPGTVSYPTQPALLSTNTTIPEPTLMLTPTQPAAPLFPTAPLSTPVSDQTVGRIVFTSYLDHFREVNGCEIYTMSFDGSQKNRWTNNDYCDWQPNWGP